MQGDNTDFDGCKSHGPWGGTGGKSWIYMPKAIIKRIAISYGDFVMGIKFYSAQNESSHFGGKFSTYSDEIFINHPNEYLTSISGTLNSHNGTVTVGSLCFGTNHSHYGPYGSDSKGIAFAYSGKDVIVGFHGRTTVSKYLGAIGIFIMPESFALGLSSAVAVNSNSTPELCSRMSMARDAGPWGGSGGKPWDDGVFSTVKQVCVHFRESLNVIYAIQFQYVHRDGKSVWSPSHGGTGGDKVELVNLDGTDEYLTGISGFYGPVRGYNGLEAITSITFHTNKMTYGPFGRETGSGYSFFNSAVSPGKVVGFHGRKWNDGFVSAIGVHMEYF